MKHLLNFQTVEVPHFTPEASYPAINKTPNDFAMEAMTLLMQSQVDTQLGALLKGSKQRDLFLLVCDGASKDVSEILTTWKKSSLFVNSILCVYAGEQADAVGRLIEKQGIALQKLSQWDRETPIAHQVVVLDEWRWFAATAASASAIHLLDVSSLSFWQSMASATVVTVAPASQSIANIALPQKKTGEVLAYWESFEDNTFQCRKLADENRRQFWEHRRQAQEKIDQLLQRVYDW